MRNNCLRQCVLSAILIITALILGPAGAQAQTWVQAGMLGDAGSIQASASSSSAINQWNVASNQSRVGPSLLRARSTRSA